VTDCFAFFGLVRRPLLDEAVLKEKYLQLAAETHPDSQDGDEAQFRAVQEAYRTLLDPATRLRHLLELEFGTTQKTTLPKHQDLFLLVGGVMQQAKTIQQHLEKSKSTLARALLAQDRNLVLKKLHDAAHSVNQARETLDCDLAALDTRWPEAGATELAELAAGLTFLTRWQFELAEMEFRLAHEGG